MAVLRPLKVVIDNYPKDRVEYVEVQNNPEDASAGTRQVPFSGEIYIEQDDFREIPPPKYTACHREGSAPAQRLFHHRKERSERRVRNLVEVHCTYDPASRGGNSPDGRKVKSTMHWSPQLMPWRRDPPLRQALPQAQPQRRRKGEDVISNLNPTHWRS